MVKYIAYINNNYISVDLNGTLGAPGIKTNTIEHPTLGTGSVGEVITADGNGGWSWSTPNETQSVTEINDLLDASHTDTNYFIGELAGQNVINATNVTAYGYNAGEYITSGSSNTLIGAYSGKNLSTGFKNTLIGESSGLTLTNQDSNIFIGEECAKNATSQRSIYIGLEAGCSSSSIYNIGIGQGAAFDNDGKYNVIIGPPASGQVDTFTCHQATSSFIGNVVIGEAAMQRTNDSPQQDDQSNWTGSNNVVIGKWASLKQTDSSNAIAIGYRAFADSNQIVLGNNYNTQLSLPGLQLNASSGDVLTFDGHHISLATPTNNGTGIEVAHAEGYSHSSTRNITSDTVFTQIKFRDSGSYATSNFIISISNSNITVLSDGVYSITFTGTTRLNNTDARTTTSFALFINEQEYYNSRIHTYNRVEPTSDNSASYTHVGHFSSGTIFDYRICIDDGPGPVLVKTTGNHLTVMKLWS